MLVKQGGSSKRSNATKSAKEAVPVGRVDYAYWCSRIHNSKSWTAPIPHLPFDFWDSDPSAFQLSRISAEDRNMML